MAVLAIAAVTGTALASAVGAPASRTAYLVETTRGSSAAVVAEARAAAAREDAQLRVARSPSQSLAAAATLVTRGARRLVVYGVDERAVLTPLLERNPGVVVERRR